MKFFALAIAMVATSVFAGNSVNISYTDKAGKQITTKKEFVRFMLDNPTYDLKAKRLNKFLRNESNLNIAKELNLATNVFQSSIDKCNDKNSFRYEKNEPNKSFCKNIKAQREILINSGGSAQNLIEQLKETYNVSDIRINIPSTVNQASFIGWIEIIDAKTDKVITDVIYRSRIHTQYGFEVLEYKNLLNGLAVAIQSRKRAENGKVTARNFNKPRLNPHRFYKNSPEKYIKANRKFINEQNLK